MVPQRGQRKDKEQIKKGRQGAPSGHQREAGRGLNREPIVVLVERTANFEHCPISGEGTHHLFYRFSPEIYLAS